MRPDKVVKKQFLQRASKDPESFYATQALKQHGYARRKCTQCQRHFWTVNDDQEACGDSACQGKISIFEDNPSKRSLSFQEVWTTFADHMHERGYAKIQRYPVVARWNPTTDFTMASIAAFQPYVISGEVEPPAQKLVIPQFCLRFGDVDNVGVTGSHCTGFVMIGQHQFVKPEDWSQNDAFEHLLTYLTDVVGLPKDELTLHEDAWAGGGNYGPCMEFFSRGVELCNQVYMLYEQTPDGEKELSLKVLDMGLGQERVAWFTQAAPTMYDAAFPDTIKKLTEATDVEFDEELYRRFAPYGTLLNLDEVEDIAQAWRSVADKVGVSVEELREKIEPMRALYSVAEHARALLVALTDGALPGNAGGYYNLRVIYRRAQDFIDEQGWDVTMGQVAQWHAQELKDLFPELSDSIQDVQELLEVEYGKWEQNKKQSYSEMAKFLKGWTSKQEDARTTNAGEHPDAYTRSLIKLYDSKGVSPDQIKRYLRAETDSLPQFTRDDHELLKPLADEFIKHLPENFYKQVSEHQADTEHQAATKKKRQLDLEGVAPTEPLYYRSYDYAQSKGVVEKIIGDKVVLDRTVFYPTSGGQMHDTGAMGDSKVVDVFKQGPHVVHVLANEPSFEEGDTVPLKIDIDRRIQLAQHHTAAHVINGAAKQVLGNHVWQAGAAKTVEKGRLDITHYDALSDEQMHAIEQVANELVRRDVPVLKHELKKSVAEQEYGFRLYQGGAVPGNKIRVIEIPDFDTEACGGTHLKTTGELQLIKLLKSTKVQDGVVRIEFVAGQAAHKYVQQRNAIRDEAMQILDISDEQLLPSRTKELFKKWKKVKKLRKKGKDVPEEYAKLTAGPSDSLDPLADAAAAVSTQEEHLPKTLKRFMDEWKK